MQSFAPWPMITERGGGQMNNANSQNTYNEQLAEIIRELQAAHKEFEELEAKLKEREVPK